MIDADSFQSLPSGALDKLIAAHDGDVALLYLWLLRRGRFSQEEAARALCRTGREVEAAAEKLRRMGLFEEKKPEPPLPPADEGHAEFTAQEIVRCNREDPNVRAIYDEAERIFGRKLSQADMSMLLSLYQQLGLPMEVVLLLLNACAESAQLRRPGSVPSPRAVEKEGYEWARREIFTLEQAEAYLRFRRSRREAVSTVCEALNIRGREPTKTEREHIASWLDLGFSPEAIAIAYDRTVTSLGTLRWPYMNKIILSWNRKGLHTPEEIEAGDSRRKPGPKTESAGVTKTDYDFTKVL